MPAIEKQEPEKCFDANLLELLPIATFVFQRGRNAKPVFTEFNQAACRLFETERHQAIGRTALEVFNENLASRFYEHQCQSLQGIEPAPFEFSLENNGSTQYYRTSFSLEFLPHGGVSRVMAITLDISAEQELKDVLRLSEAASGEIEQFVYLAAHDLRSPMRNVNMIADFLRDGFQDLGDGKLELINKLEAIASAAVDLVNNILSHAEMQQLVTSEQEFSLDRMCKNIIATLDLHENHERSIDNVILHADKNVVQTALNNLISNAIKHNADTPVALKISAHSSASGFIDITVQDDGRGVNDAESLFDAKPGSYSKSGYGLMAVRKLLKHRGGSIRAFTNPGGSGLSVVFSLPGKIVENVSLTER